MRRVLVGLSLVATLILVPTTATAAQPPPAIRPATTADRLAQPNNVWEDVAWFYNVIDCVNVGDYGRDEGTWSAYECSYQPKRNYDKPYLLRAFFNT